MTLVSTLQLIYTHVVLSRQKESIGGEKPSAVCIVFAVEIFKLILCFFMEYFFCSPRHILKCVICDIGKIYVSKNSKKVSRDGIVLAIPAFLFSIQNNLLHYAISNLSPTAFLVLLQTKIPLTAILSRLLLSTRMHTHQMVSLTLLTLGVILTQIESQKLNQHKSIEKNTIKLTSSNVETSNPIFRLISHPGAILAVLVASFSSAFCSILSEYLFRPTSSVPGINITGPKLSLTRIKKKNKKFDTVNGVVKRKDPKVSLWIQIARLGVFALLFSSIIMILDMCGGRGIESPFTHFSLQTCILVVFQSVSGILSAVVSRHTSAVMRAYSNSASIVLQALLSRIFLLEDAEIGMQASKTGGILLVTISLILYAFPPFS